MLLDNHSLLEMLLIMMPGRLTYISLMLVPHCGRRFWYQDLLFSIWNVSAVPLPHAEIWIVSMCLELNSWQCWTIPLPLPAKGDHRLTDEFTEQTGFLACILSGLYLVLMQQFQPYWLICWKQK